MTPGAAWRLVALARRMLVQEPAERGMQLRVVYTLMVDREPREMTL